MYRFGRHGLEERTPFTWPGIRMGPEVACPTVIFRGLLGQAQPILITEGPAVADY